MPSYTLEIEAFGVFATNTPSLEIWEDGVLDSTHLISATGTSIIVTINYPGTVPTSLALTFNDGFAPNGRTIEIQSVKINDKYVNVGNYLSSDSLTHGASANVDIANSGFFYDDSEPVAGDFLPATRTFTAGNDTYRGFNSGADEAFDMLAGRDVAYLGSGNDAVNGGAGDDVIFGGAGNDLLYGAGDNDVLRGQDGDDLIYGGTGNDRITGGNDDDEIHGNDGDDRLSGNNGSDVITGGAGNDRIIGGGGAADSNFLFGDEGDDILIGGGGDDTLDGGDDDDLLYGGNGDDILEGGDGNDTLVGDAGDDRLDGNDGNDILNGRADDDELNGGDGDDLLVGEDGIDTLNGDANNDILVGGDGADTLNGGTGNDTLHGGGLTVTEIRTILNANPGVVFNSYTNSFYQYVNTGTNWTTANNTATTTLLSGVAGHLVNITSATENAYIESLMDGGSSVWTSGGGLGAGAAWTWSGGAEDGIQFSQGATAVNNMYENWAGGEPNAGAQVYARIREGSADWTDRSATDTFHYVIEWDAGLMSDDLAVDTLNGGDGDDFLYGYGGNDILNGNADDDVVIGGAGDDTIDGGTGDDALYGGDNNDTITGGTGADHLDGGDGDDILYAADSTTSNILDVDFDTSTDGFVYADDVFLGTNQPAFASGVRITNDGNTANGALEVTLGGVNGTDLGPMSGAWQETFNLATAMADVSISFAYRSLNSGGSPFETGEDLFLYADLDGEFLSNTANDYFDFELDPNGGYNSGWQTITFNVGGLDAGNHTLSLGGYLTFKTQTGEEVEIRYDDVLITGTAVGDSGISNTADGGAGDDTIYGGAGNDTINGGADDDEVSGFDGDDTISGGTGDDTLYGGDDDDDIYGVDAADSATASANAGNTITNLYSATFNANTEGFTYADVSSGAYASGAHDATDGGAANGSLEMLLGGLDNNNINNMSGAWSDTFNLGGAQTDLILTFSYRVEDNVVDTDPFDAGEDLTLFVDIDGTNYSNDANPYFFEILGTAAGTSYDSGWQTISLNVGALAAGNHTLTFTGLLDRKTFASEEYSIHFDDVSIDTLPVGTATGTTNMIYGQDGLDTLYGSTETDIFVFDSSAFNDVDVIENFDVTEVDALDISDILVDFNGNITDYVQFTDSGGNTLVGIDANGATGGASFTNIAQINGLTGMDELSVYLSGGIVA